MRTASREFGKIIRKYRKYDRTMNDETPFLFGQSINERHIKYVRELEAKNKASTDTCFWWQKVEKERAAERDSRKA